MGLDGKEFVDIATWGGNIVSSLNQMWLQI